MKRRDFLKSAGAIAAGSLLVDEAFAGIGPRFFAPSTLPILQGYTTASETQLSVCVGRGASVRYSLIDLATKKRIQPKSIKSATYGISVNQVDKVQFAGLQLGRTYNFVVESNDRSRLIDSRFLKTVDLNNANARVGIMSCMKDFFVSKNAVTEIWKSAALANLDYIFFIGDSVYGDLGPVNGPLILWNRYVESRLSIPFYHWSNLKPVISVWDDHDFGINDGTGEWEHKLASFNHFQNFFAQESDRKNLFKGPGVATCLKAFGQNFVCLDNRFFRGSKTGSASNAFFGESQIDWLTNLITHDPRPTIVLNGAPLFGRLQKKSSYQHVSPVEFELFFKKLSGTGAPIIFGGGDLHYSEVSAISQNYLGYKSFELISSCMHSNVPKALYDNPNAHLHGVRSENFLVVQNNGKAGDASWQVDCLTRGNRKAFSAELTI